MEFFEQILRVLDLVQGEEFMRLCETYSGFFWRGFFG